LVGLVDASQSLKHFAYKLLAQPHLGMDRGLALMFLLPKPLSEAVDEFRRRLDKTCETWPPHVRIMWPCPAGAASREGVAALKRSLRDLPPVPMDCSGLQVGTGESRKSKDGRQWLCLVPPEGHPCREGFALVSRRVQEAFSIGDQGVCVSACHITLGQVSSTAEAKQVVREFHAGGGLWGGASPLQVDEWVASAVSLCSRGSSGRFREVALLPLEGSTQALFHPLGDGGEQGREADADQEQEWR